MSRRLILLPVLVAVSACSGGNGAEAGAGTGATSGSGGVAASAGGAPAMTAAKGGMNGAGAASLPNGGAGSASGGAAGSASPGSGGANGGAGGSEPASAGRTGSGGSGVSVGGAGGLGMGGGPEAMGGAPAMSGAAGAAAGGSAGVGPTALDLIAAPDGEADAPGTLEQPTTLTAALSRIAAGHTIFLRGGTYASAAQITIAADQSGTSGSPKRLVPYASEKPKLDFSSQPYGTDSNPRGLQLNASYWHVQGLEVVGSADNGIYVAGNDNVIEGCVTHGNRDTGLQLGRASSDLADPADWPSNNLIVNCESYDNYDAPPGGGENADGFAAKLTVGIGNVFRGCVSHHNIDDGWDLYTKSDTGPIGPVTIDQSIAYANGTLTDGTTNDNGDRNGFKLGGEDIAVAHVVTRSVAFDNGKNGFTWNSNPGAIRLSNCLAFDNAEGNFKFGDNSTPTSAVFTNNVSFWTSTASSQSDKAIGTDAGSTNVWWDDEESQPSISGKGLIVTAADFASSLAAPSITRNPDGSPSFTPFALASGSDLVNAGQVPAGALPFEAASYYSGAPDLGAVESP
jgi:pectate disaccharide-lyase